MERDQRNGYERMLGERLTRRSFLRATGMSGAALGLGAVLAACKSSSGGGGTTGASGGAGEAVKVGYVSPQTGPLAPFGEADAYVIGAVKDQLTGLTIAGKTRDIQIIEKDSQSDPNRAAQVASDLITSDGVDLMLVAGTPETTNPVSGQCEANGVPCISTVAPWQPWFLGQQKDPANPVPFKFAYHFFWGLEDIEQVFLDMWNTINTNKKVAGLFPNDGDGNAWGDPNLGFPSFFGPNGYEIVDPGPLRGRHAGLQRADLGVQEGERPDPHRCADPARLHELLEAGEPAGLRAEDRVGGQGAAVPVVRRGARPHRRGDVHRVLVGADAPVQLVAHGSDGAGSSPTRTRRRRARQWTQPIGFAHALFEVATDVLQRTTDLTPDAIVAAIVATNLNTIVGQIQWTGQPFPNVAKTQLVGGQWKKGSDFPYELVVVSNKALPSSADRRNVRSDPRIVRRRIRIEPDGTW